MGRYISKKQNIQEANIALENRKIMGNTGWAKTPTLTPMDEQDKPAYTKDQLRSMGTEIQRGLEELKNKLKGKIVKIKGKEEMDYYVLSLDISDISTMSKKDPSIIGEIQITYADNPEGSKLRQQVLVGHFKSTDTPMVANEFTTLFPDSFTGARPYTSTELQNYLNSVVTKVLDKTKL